MKCIVCHIETERGNLNKANAAWSVFEGMALCKTHFDERWQMIVMADERKGGIRTGGIVVPSNNGG